jgi:hypothetical protein
LWRQWLLLRLLMLLMLQRVLLLMWRRLVWRLLRLNALSVGWAPHLRRGGGVVIKRLRHHDHRNG